MTFIIKETFIMNFGGFPMRIRIAIGVRNGFQLPPQLYPLHFVGS